jgi:hypothetical protein
MQYIQAREAQEKTKQLGIADVSQAADIGCSLRVE